MCNWYALQKVRARRIAEAAKAAANVTNQSDFNLDIFPNKPGLVVHNGPDGRELAYARWGMPTPEVHLVTPTGKPKAYDPGVTNIRELKSPHWRRWFGPEHRCLVPFTAFSEPSNQPGHGYRPVWFELIERPAWDMEEGGAPLGFLAGLYQPGWTSVRKNIDGPTTDDLYAFLTTKPNAEVAPIHPKAMPVILTTKAEIELWMSAPWEEARALQRPLANGSLRTVERMADVVDPADPQASLL